MSGADSIDLARILSLPEFEALARPTLEGATYDYVAGGSWEEASLAENEAAWRRQTLRPRVLVGGTPTSTATTMLGEPATMPVAIAPVAAQGMVHPLAEVATARAAAAAGIPFVLSTFSTRSIEEVAAATPSATRWFQLYAQADPRRTRNLVERAEAAGFRAIVLTVDLPVVGYRERERRHGFLLVGPPGTSAVAASGDADGAGSVDDLLTASLGWADLAVIRSWAPKLPLVLKGILTAEDARLAVEHGADAIVVSNHGGRQLDRVAATVDALEEVVDAVRGRTEIWVDGGVRRGLDVAIALALGARGVLLGRPAIWALAAAGQAGVERALAIVREELEIAMALLGTATPADITRSHVARHVTHGPSSRPEAPTP
jgi:4-hydroxymandelate oxidase